MDNEGMTPLSRAYESGHVALAELMLHQEREENSESLKGSTPLHRAAYLGLTEAIESLIRYGADPMIADRTGDIPLHKAVREGHLAAAQALAAVSNVNQSNNYGMTALHWACLNGRTDIAEMLLQYGADAYLRCACLDSLSPVEMAVKMRYVDLREQLGVKESFV
jgi:ankyrin repeat protein